MERIITVITDEGIAVDEGQDADDILQEMRMAIAQSSNCSSGINNLRHEQDNRL